MATTTDELLAGLPVGSTMERTDTGFAVNRRAGNGFQHGAGATVGDALADIGALTPEEAAAVAKSKAQAAAIAAPAPEAAPEAPPAE